MMNVRIKDFLIGFLLTALLLVCLQILSTAILPLFGLAKYRLPFNVLIILFLAFKLENPFLAVLILAYQYIYSFFSVEGWAMGTFAGVIVSVVIIYLKDVIHFSSIFLTILVTEIFQFVWFLVISTLIYMQVGTWDYIFDKLGRFIPESLVISFLAPFVFSFLDKVWKVDNQEKSHSFRGGF